MTAEPSHPRAPASKHKLTPKQRRLMNEIKEISEAVRMDHWNILDYQEDAHVDFGGYEAKIDQR
jgi:hypothetical protein